MCHCSYWCRKPRSKPLKTVAKAERIQRSESEEVEDRLLQAAQALRSGETVEAPEIMPGEFKGFKHCLSK